MERQVSIREIAEAAHVSTATVSRVFNDSGYVQEETRQTVLAVAEKMHYHPKQYQKRVRSQRRTQLVGVVVADLQNVFFQEIITHLTEVLNAHQIGVILCNSAESAQQEIRCLDMLEQLHVSGIIISPISETVSFNADFLKRLHREGVPLILVDRDIKGIGLDGVFQDNFAGAVKAVNALLECGHTRIATIAGPLTSMPGYDRLNGYLDALRTAGLPVRNEYICYGDFKLESGYNHAMTLLKSYPEITALFCANNLMAVGALRAVRDLGLSVPEDISVIAYGSLDQFDLYDDARISSLDQPADLMGEECGRIMLERLDGTRKRRSEPARRITYDATLQLKGS